MPIDSTLPPDEQTFLEEREDEALYRAAIKLDRFTKSRFRGIHTAMAEYVNEFSTKPEELMVDYTDRVKHVVEAGYIEEAMRAASAVGDDRLQYRSRGYVVPDSFTHGTSEQRVRWFRRGYETGDLSQGDTFNAREL